MVESMSRRRALAIITAGAASAPAATLPAAAQPMLENLFARRAEARRDRQVTKAAVDAAQARYDAMRPEYPEALKLTWRDMLGMPVECDWLEKIPGDGIAEQRYRMTVDHWREMVTRMAADPNARAGRLDWARHRLYLAERYTAADDAAYFASGCDPAIGRDNDVYCLLIEIETEIAAA